jgi:hypothetical protein
MEREYCRAFGKVCYRTKAAARKGAKHSSFAARIYICEKCQFFHLTKKEDVRKVEQPPSAAKLRRRLENYGREIKSCDARLAKAEKARADRQARVEKEHAEEVAWLNRYLDRVIRR